MKQFRIVLEGKTFQVTVDDPWANPVRVTVDGETYDVQLESLDSAPDAPAPPAARAAGSAAPSGHVVKAPIPGTIGKVSVKAGDRVEYGQELCVLEAMKMNNVIRAPGPGQIAEVRVTVKQSVQHGDVLIVFAG